MDLDELKYQLNHKLSTDHARKSAMDIAALLKKKTHSLIGKLKRSLWIEIVCCIIFLIPMGYVGLCSDHWSLRIYFGTFAILMAAFMLLLIYLLRRIDQLGRTNMPVKSNLQTIVNILEEFVKRYFQFCMALIPICFTFSFLVSIKDPIRIPQVEKVATRLFTAPWQLYTFLAVYMIGLAVSVYYFTRWYLKKLYGNHIAQLKECINELREA